MRAIIISVGTEHLAGKITDSNAVYISRELVNFNISTYLRLTLPDNKKVIRDYIKKILNDADIIFTIAGLGPTHDDITKEAVSEAIGQKLIYSNEIWEHIENRFKLFKGIPTENNKKQAYYFEKGKWFKNENGTAPGLYTFCKKSSAHFFMLPGLPGELIPLFKNHVCKELKTFGNINTGKESKIFRIYNAGESRLAETINSVLDEFKNIEYGIYLKPEAYIELDFKISADKINNDFAVFENKLKKELKKSDFLITDNIPLSKVTGDYLKNKGLTIGFAESITGGSMMAEMVQIPGCSAYLKGGIVAYSNNIKTELLNVRKETIMNFGAVSAECAEEMAQGILKKLDCSIGVSITGIAGPDGGTPTKPVGLCYIGISDSTNIKTYKINLFGNRQVIIKRAVNRVFTELINFLNIY